MKKNRCVITITDNIAPTSMPVNEFAFFRNNNYLNEKQIIVLLFKNKISENIRIPDEIEVLCVGKDCRQLRNIIYDIVSMCKRDNMDYVFHIHEAKSVIFFNCVTAFTFVDRVVYTLHSTFVNYSFHNKILSFLAVFQVRYVVCVSNTSYKHFPGCLKKYFRNRILAIQNGVDISRIDGIISKGRSYKENVDDFTDLVYIARLIPLKRHWILFRVMQKIKNIRLILIGSGNLKCKYVEMAKNFGIVDRVVFEGGISRDDVYKKLLGADIYVSSSSYEGLPISLLEAMACYKICIVSNIEQHMEIANKCKCLVTVDDKLSNWIDIVKKMIKLNKNLKEDIELANGNDVRKFFSLDRMHDEYSRLYDVICGKYKDK